MVSTIIKYSTASILPNTLFDEAQEAQLLRDSLQKKNGKTTSDLVACMGRNTTDQRIKLLIRYNQQFNGNLIDEVNKAMTGLIGGDKDCSELIAMCLKSLYELDVDTLMTASKEGAEMNYMFCDVILPKSNHELDLLQEAYSQANGGKKLIDFTNESFKKSLFFRDVLAARLTSPRDEPSPKALLYDSRKNLVDEKLVSSDLLLLEEKVLKDFSKNVNIFIKLITSRSYMHLQSIIEGYKAKWNVSLYEAFEKVISSSDKKTLGDNLVSEVKMSLLCLGEKPAYFAKRIYKSVEGIGTKDNQLRRLILGRVEIDLEDIKRAYNLNYRKSLRQQVYDDTSGDYRKLLMYLIGG